jgi:hypothetical protein
MSAEKFSSCRVGAETMVPAASSQNIARYRGDDKHMVFFGWY